MTTPRGIRNRNPGNIIVAGWTQRQSGYLGPEAEGRFARFDTMANGLVALMRLLQNYRGQGLTTVRGIINKWAPPVENDTSAYVLAVAKALNVGPDQELPDEPWVYHSLARAITGHENGRQAAADGISDRDYAEAMATLFGTETVVAAPEPGPVPEPKPSIKEKIVAIPGLVLAAGQALLPLVIDLFKARGTKTSERNAGVVEAVGPTLIAIAKEVVGGSGNEQQVAEAILANKELQNQFRAAVALKWTDVEPFLRFEEESRGKAREFVDLMTSDGPQWRQIGWAFLIGMLSLMIIGGVGYTFWNVLFAEGTAFSQSTRDGVVELMKNVAILVIGFFFGSSASNRQKDVTIEEQARR